MKTSVLDSARTKLDKGDSVESRECGAFVISLDFELYWGVRDYVMTHPSYLGNVEGERGAIPEILKAFHEYDIAATWATVGFLFADSLEEFESFKPKKLPEYGDRSLSPYEDSFDQIKCEPSIYFAPDLIRMISHTPMQEIATHTYSHYYCLEAGQTSDDFRSDIESAIAIASKFEVKPRSIVFPRNQHNPKYDKILIENGIICFRGNQSSQIYQFGGNTQRNPLYRLARLADSYVSLTGKNTYKWPVPALGSLVNIPASLFLRPVSKISGLYEDQQFRRIAKCLDRAAHRNEVFHLWWHPHNFGVHLKENIGFLRRILDHFEQLRLKSGLKSFSMVGLAEQAARG
ncbi:polysaccharide deacetylase family protein [soil metagenome]